MSPKSALIIGMDSVAQRLSVHASDPSRLRAAHAIAMRLIASFAAATGPEFRRTFPLTAQPTNHRRLEEAAMTAVTRESGLVDPPQCCVGDRAKRGVALLCP
jgi:hypothetical protein